MKSSHYILLYLTLCLVACHKEPLLPQGRSTSLQVAVLMRRQELPRWERTAIWAQENIRKAQVGMQTPVDLHISLHVQDNMTTEQMERLIRDADAIVGPSTSACAMALASLLAKTDKPMLSPTATGVEYQRRFSAKDNIWNMAECDIAQLEALLSVIESTDTYRRVALLTPDGDIEGNNCEFVRWFGFLATEYHLQVDGLYFYTTEQEVREHAHSLCDTSWNKSEVALIFVPSSSAAVIAFDDEVQKIKASLPKDKHLYTPQVYTTDVFLSDSVLTTAGDLSYQGLTLYPSPESGFATMYATHFGDEIQNGEAQLYDALMMLSLAAAYRRTNGENISLNDALQAIVNGTDEGHCDWLPTGLHTAFKMIEAGLQPDVNGATGALDFDIANHTGIKGTCYRLWRMSNGKVYNLGYLSGEEGNRTYNSTSHWDQTSSTYQSFDESTTHYPTYPPLSNRWALLVAGSCGWANYRFQADIFAMYASLRQGGYEDDHIILICEDDIAYHSANTEQGVLRVSADGENVYRAEAVDYKLSSLSAEDLNDIITGQASERLPKVIRATDTDNVFIFWSGHGDIVEFNFGGRQIHHRTIVNALKKMSHRKMLMAVEACYSGSFGQTCETIPGLLIITAANPYETSHATIWDETLGIYRTNGFTHGFQSAIKKKQLSLRELYYNLARSTNGSHVTVYNAPYYGNMYKESLSDFFPI